MAALIKKKKPSSSVRFRVWRLHSRMNHTHLRTIALMIRLLILRNADCTADEVMLVAAHQDCWACAIAKWRKLDQQIPSGLTPIIFGAHWSCDINGPYKTLAIGGFKYQAVFVERSKGYVSTFLEKSKDDIVTCLKRLNDLCRANGHLWQTLKIDMGSVENGKDFLYACGQINLDRDRPGIAVNPANVACQQENMAERTIQTKNNIEGAMNVDQDLLGASCWGLLALAASDTINNTINVHTEDTGLTPANHMYRTEGVDVQDAFPIGWGKPVIFSRVKRAPPPRLPGQARNEFGVAVGHGRAWGSVWVLAPGRNVWSVVLRRHVREIRLKAQQQMSLQEGQRYLPSASPDGETILVTRGDTGMLAKSFAMECTEDLGVALESDEIPISRLDSTISYDNITAETTNKCDWDATTAGNAVRLDTANEEAQLDLGTGRIRTLEELGPVVRDQSPGFNKEADIPGLHSTTVRSRRLNAETLPERYLAHVVEASTSGPYTITKLHGTGNDQS